MAAIGGQDEAILNSNNLSVTKFNSCVSSVCQLALSIGSSVEGLVLFYYMNMILVVIFLIVFAMPKEIRRRENYLQSKVKL